MLLYSGSLKELLQPESSARTPLKGTEMGCGLNFKLRAFPTTESGLLFSPLSASAGWTSAHHLATEDSYSQLLPVELIPTPLLFYTVIQQSLAEGLLHFQSIGSPAFRQAVVFFDCIPDGCFRLHCLPWDTHAGSYFPSFFFWAPSFSVFQWLRKSLL